MRTRRLYLPAPLGAGAHLLTSDRSHYLKNVLRVRDGVLLQVFDGLGNTANATVRSDHRKLILDLDEPVRQPAPAGPRVHLAVALLKGKAMEQVLRKSTELGATDLWPIYSKHTDVSKRALNQADNHHWLSVLSSAAEQCGQNYLPTLHDGQHFEALLGQLPATQHLLTDASGDDWPANLPQVDTLLIIGPEGGWSESELHQASAASISIVNLGPLILRAETAPLVALTTLQVGWRFAVKQVQG